MTEDELEQELETRLAAITEAASRRHETDKPALARAIALGEELKQAYAALGFRAQDELREAFGDQSFGDCPDHEMEAAEESVRQLVESAGCRLVSGGQESSYYEDGTCDVVWSDFRTGEVLASGRVAGAEAAEPWCGLPMPDNAFLADYIGDRVYDALSGGTPAAGAAIED